MKCFDTNIITKLKYLSLTTHFYRGRRYFYWFQLYPSSRQLFLYSHETDFMQGLQRKNVARSFHFTFPIYILYKVWWLCRSHLSHKTWNEWQQRYSHVSFIFWSTPRYRRQGPLKKETLRHSSSICIWSNYLTIDTLLVCGLCQNFLYLGGFVAVITFVFRSPS